jgi:hypothetical protein
LIKIINHGAPLDKGVTVSPAKAKASSGTSARSKLPRERTHFKELLLANHFGTIPGSELEAKAAPSGDTTFEQLMCVGYQPQLKRLDAVVHIKRGSGYSGGLCTAGSKEYVKFFVSTDGGTTWAEKGTVSFAVWDVDAPKPLEFDATLFVDLEEECCKEENLMLVRAILSWEVPPGGPDDEVVWGNSLDATIQVEPMHHGSLLELLECLDVKLPIEEVSTLADPGGPVEFAAPKQLTPLELHKAYKGSKVPQHRYLLGHLQHTLDNPAALTETLAQPGFELFPGVEVDISKLIELLIDPQGDETYEQIGCVGLNEDTAELVATIDMKLPSGYSGGLCTSGSREYVAFWVDWEDGAGLQYVGTTSVNVHDISSIPKGGLRYSAVLPFPQLLSHRQPCEDGPRTALVRAVLSWATPPSTTNPFAVPVWGGHAQTRILLPPGEPIAGGGPLLESIGSMARLKIDDLTGLATGQSVVGFGAFESPFGGSVNFAGYVINPATDLPGGPGYQYRLLTSSDGVTYTPVTTPFTATTMQLPSGIQTNVPQTPDPNGWVPYLANLSSGPPYLTVVGNTLGYWQSAGDGRAWIKMEARDGLHNPLGSTPPKLIQLDNTAPKSTISITSGGGSCGDFKVGDTIAGSYSSSDNEALAHPGVGFSVEPGIGGGAFGSTPSLTTLTFQEGTWELDTEGMSPCGYVVRLDGYDRTIVNSGFVGWDGPAFTGFCLKK